MTFLGFSISVLAVLLCTVWLFGVVVLSAWRLLWSVPKIRAALERLAPLGIFLPVLLGIAVTLAAVVPMGHSCHCAREAAVGLHLCVAHPARSLSMLPLALVPLAAFCWRLRVPVPRVLRRLWRCATVGSPRSLLSRVPVGTGNAFSVALPRPRILVDRDLWYELSIPERRILLEHEVGHLRRGDPLLLEMLTVIRLFLPQKLSGCALGAWRDYAERQADARAARAVGDPLSVASLLLRLHRRAHAERLQALAFHDGRGLEARVRALLEGTTVIQPVWGAARTACLLTGATAALPVLTAHELHHILESVLGLVLL